jgi:biopolymer transport protein ExbB
MNTILQEMWKTWATGGPVMTAMAVLAIMMFVTAIRLLLKLNFKGIARESDTTLRTWVVDPTLAPQRIRELVRYTQDEIHSVRDIEGRFREVEANEVTEMDRGVAFLNVLVISSPLFGLLGTVMGMLLTFKAIGVGGSSTSEVIAKGISEALVCTQTGMMVAVPGLIMATMAKRRRHEYVAFLARLEGITLRHFRPEFGGMTRLFTRKEAKLAEAKAVAETQAAADAKVREIQPALA